MSTKKDGKITLGMLKGKPVTTSVPSISIKFHANAEKIEELRFSDDDTPNSDEKNHQLGNLIPITSSSDQDTSPLKLLPKLVKRSTSIDVSAQSLSSSPPTDPWRFFSDIKGKITKSVEEKITEIKARHEEGSPMHKSKSEVKAPKDDKTEKDPSNKENSSFSDSEDQSESSISKTCGFISTTEGVEMSSDDDTPSIDKDKKSHSPNVRHRFRFLKSHGKGQLKEGTINIGSLSKIYNINTEKVDQALPEHTEDVESAVDALEETDFKDSLPKNTEKVISNEAILEKVTEKIDNIELEDDKVVKIKEVQGEDIRKSFFSSGNTMTHVFAPTGFVDVRSSPNFSDEEKNVLPWLALAIYIVVYAILHTYMPYLAGLMLGMSLALILGYIYIKLYTDVCLNVFDHKVNTNANLNNRIMEIPAVKEYQPVTKYEGWINEYPDKYDPATYHISQTQSVFLRLQGNLLRISHSKSKIPKRAMWNEPEIKPHYTNHRIYNLLHAKITLLPEGLTKIRLWSKKYPICVTLSNEQTNFDPTVFKMEVDDDKEEKLHGKSPKNKKKFTFKKKEYPYMAQRFSKLSEDQDIDFDSDSRASTPSPEIPEFNHDDIFLPCGEDDKNEEEDMHSLPDDWSTGSRNESPMEMKLYFFGRTDREKEDWFRRLVAATHHSEEILMADMENVKDSEGVLEVARMQIEYLKYMTFFNKINFKRTKQEKTETAISEEAEDKLENAQLWLNTLLGRVLFDCMRNPEFSKKFQNRIQKKLQTIKLPYFIEEIIITELNLGKTPPLILNTEKPSLNERGIWIDLDISYEGSVVLTLQTKLNLMKLKNPPTNDKPPEGTKSAIYHSDVDDSAESSSDEDGPQELPVTKETGATATPPTHGSKKFMKMMDKIAESKFFQVATDNRYIKKAMEGVSNTELRLTVEIKALSGTLVLNIPPPPSDRIWVGFRPTPELILTAHPIVGDRNVSYAMVTSWIEKKLLQEFQKVMVIPNMEDFLVPVMNSKLPE
ncbi:testis-expressed protein 2 isoform X4 [Rhynchophorus ferrugineus]|uniref:testis-expressed protein 2 isoform X4 n=1 Tax=Rhynchophorus ferrugineus TaxID=354439 RepID=UPI003FCE906C